MIKFDVWIDLPELKKAVDLEQTELMDDRALWGRKGETFREAWVAVKFAEPFGANQVCIPSDDSLGPDFLAKQNDRIFKLQSVNVLAPDRKPGTENRLAEGLRHVSQEEMDKAFHGIPDALKRAVQKKLGKYAPHTLSLVMYLNTGAFIFDHQRSQVDTWIVEATESLLDEFISVFILQNGNLLERCRDGTLKQVVAASADRAF